MDKVKLVYLIYSAYRYFFVLFQKFAGYPREKRKFRKATGHNLILKNPESFPEKIVWKKLYDRNPLLPLVADKFRVRDYIKAILGQKTAKDILVPLFYVTDKPTTIPFKRLPEQYVIKPNHASGKYIIVDKSNSLDPKQIIAQCKMWLSKPYGYMNHEWAYQSIKPKIVIEKLLLDDKENLPNDYKFFVFHGKCHLIQSIYDRLSDVKLAFYTPDWKYLDIRAKKGFKQAVCQDKPKKLSAMIDLAESLGRYFDAIRVDLYLVDDKIYFGELTNYHMAGKFFWQPEACNYEVGKKWQLTPDYWRHQNYIKEVYKNHFLRKVFNKCA